MRSSSRVEFQLWTQLHPEALERFGREADRDIALSYGVSRSRIRDWRIQLGIDSCPRARVRLRAGTTRAGVAKWREAHPEVRERLGRETDVDIARSCEVPSEWIRGWRLEIGIERFRPVRAPVARASVAQEITRRGPRMTRIPPEWLDHFGRKPDRDVAELLGMKLERVRYYREKFGIPVGPRATRRVAPIGERLAKKYPGLLDRLGKEPDRDIAESLGMKVDKVRYCRRKLGIPTGPRAAHRGGQPRVRTAVNEALDVWLSFHPEAREELGREPDWVIAAAYGLQCGVLALARWRVSLGIRSTYGPLGRPRTVVVHEHGSLGRPRTVAYEHLLGTLPDADVAKIAGVTRSAVQAVRVHRGIPRAVKPSIDAQLDAWLASHPEVYERLGRDPDQALAETCGFACSVASFTCWRQKRGIRARPVLPYEHLLGVVTDAEIARAFGLSFVTVGNVRRRRGIPAVPRRGKVL